VSSRAPSECARTIVVAAAVIERDDRFLVTKRQRGVHLEGFWEFPGGKCEPGEDCAACLARELDEELGVRVHIGNEIYATKHAYADRSVELHFFQCEPVGEPVPQIGQEMRWVRRADLAELQFPPADAELIRRLAGRA
jgi:8-oxo-dGTP diphosphatase